MKANLCVALASLAILSLCSFLPAADVKPTAIKLESIHCAGCAKKIVAKVSTIVGVAKVETDLKAAVVKVQPKPAFELSPRALWQAVEEAGQKPVKLEGPSGTFTSLPPE